MKEYDFLNLSPHEFEVLTRDLLQKKMGIYLESFGDGADQGIDLRYSQGSGMIVQCKRYKDFQSLLPILKKKVEKVKLLSPVRYILSTSASLLPRQKETIVTLFAPHIWSTEDIYSKQDLNNLLAIFPEVERNFHKLWLTSSTILQEIINSQVVNQSRFAKKEISEKVKVYVQNDSFIESLSILNKNKYIIISGIPGIGKTTLAEMLVFHLLGQGTEEFIFLSDTINDGFKFFNESKKQIFLFDDFLGRNFLQSKIATNEEKQILRFIRRIQNSSNSLLILTTREYILNQAKQKFEDFDTASLSKCVLDLSKYSTIVRAEILYNHLFINEIPSEYVHEIIKKNYLFKIINHKNYNPRIIESFTNSRVWESVGLQDFPDKVLRLFDNPYLVWKHVYENQISELSRIVLDCLLIVGEEIEYNQLFNQVKKYTLANSKSINSNLNIHAFKSALKELENSLIRIKINSDKSYSISYQNPSVQDFLVNYISNDCISKQNLLDSILFINPALNIISTELNGETSKNKLLVNEREMRRIEQNIINSFDEMLFDSKYFRWSNPTDDDVLFLKLSRIISLKGVIESSMEFIKQRFLDKIYSDNITNKSIADYVLLFECFHEEAEIDVLRIMYNISGAFYDFDDLQSLYVIKELYPEEFEQFQEEEEDVYNDIFTNIVDEICNENHDDIKSYEDNIMRLEGLESDFNLYVYDAVKKINAKIEELKVKEERHFLYEEDEYDYFGRHRYYLDYHDKDYRREANNIPPVGRQVKSQDDIIINLFKSLG